MIHKDTLAKLGVKDAEGWSLLLNGTLVQYSIDSKYRFCAFLSQTLHESNNFNSLVENLNYGKDGLLKVFGKYFNEKDAEIYQRKPQSIANRVYANRMGNGNFDSGEGWKFRGRGILQVTGKSNYSLCSMAIYKDNRLLDTPELLEQKEGALLSACWYWTMRSINKTADNNDVKSVTLLVNGGLNGLDDRIKKYELLKSEWI